ncbi:hypothetical protein BDN72DRAFT_830100 [Pluteus cervinus]|uniref:Uncharacterized protein n=1 Tax=Pluteus cervinus TaxID=181527 RepID=A0ACD3BFX1_9AGAR|nr:hypothetical protein BDN72DRAFT_830100 [Pluteus cervinus]
MTTPPPYYILLSHSTLSAAKDGPPSALGHPVIQYQYQDDSPLALLPTHPSEQVLVMDFDTSTASPSVRSISSRLAVTGLAVEKLPGASADDGETKNDRMYTVETIGGIDLAQVPEDQGDVQVILTQFKQRNAQLRRALGHHSHAPSPTPVGGQPKSHESERDIHHAP